MLLPDWAVLNAAVDWLANGLWNLSWWQIVIYTLVTTHITIAGVTIFLHRSQAHRALDLHRVPAHFFRFWLWLSTGMVTREWVAIHRKHHAKCETAEDPHSPQTRGIDTVFWKGSELYRAEAKNLETLAKFGHGTPDDWIERNLYTRYSWQGVGLMLILKSSFWAKRQFIRAQYARPKWVYPFRRLMRKKPEFAPVFWQQALRAEKVVTKRSGRRLSRGRKQVRRYFRKLFR
mgnify:CR=1 FL=1